MASLTRCWLWSTWVYKLCQYLIVWINSWLWWWVREWPCVVVLSLSLSSSIGFVASFWRKLPSLTWSTRNQGRLVLRESDGDEGEEDGDDEDDGFVRMAVIIFPKLISLFFSIDFWDGKSFLQTWNFWLFVLWLLLFGLESVDRDHFPPESDFAVDTSLRLLEVVIF